MRKAHIIALVAQFWAFVLSFIILLAGKNKQMTGLYFVKVCFLLLVRSQLRSNIAAVQYHKSWSRCFTRFDAVRHEQFEHCVFNRNDLQQDAHGTL